MRTHDSDGHPNLAGGMLWSLALTAVLLTLIHAVVAAWRRGDSRSATTIVAGIGGTIVLGVITTVAFPADGGLAALLLALTAVVAPAAATTAWHCLRRPGRLTV